MQGDASYFTRRADEERLAAMKAEHPDARKAHLALANRYTDRARDTAAHHVRDLDKVS